MKEDKELFSSYLNEKRQQTWEVISRCLEEFQQADAQVLTMMGQDDYQPLLEEHWQIVRDYPSRLGKYLRPGLVLLMAEALGVDTRQALITAAAMQTSEDWILIHDDLVDGSMERRGRKALHRLCGEEIAVNAGDTLHECMHRILNKNHELLEPLLAQRVSREFFQMLSRTTFGQFAEIKWTVEDKQDMTEQDVLFTIGGKTVYYTIAGPLRLGAILAGATEEQLRRIFRFSIPLGLCFQIRDDVLDLTSDFEGMKKQTCNDIYEGKRTLILLHLLAHASAYEQAAVRDVLAKSRNEKTQEEVSYIRRLMDKYGSIQYAEEKARSYAEESMKLLDTIDFIHDEHYKELFRSMVQFILNRSL